MSGIEGTELRELADALATFPANGKPPNTDVTTTLVLLGFIERREVKKPCRNCGTPLVDYSFMRVTSAGRYFLAAADAKPLPETKAQP